MTTTHQITTLEQLDALYGDPVRAAIVKEIDYISDHYKAFIDKAPFVVVATVGPEGLDCSPRGDPPGFVRVVDKKTVLIPDRRGNNRVDCPAQPGARPAHLAAVHDSGDRQYPAHQRTGGDFDRARSPRQLRNER